MNDVSGFFLPSRKSVAGFRTGYSIPQSAEPEVNGHIEFYAADRTVYR
jgi:hypothetical protein